MIVLSRIKNSVQAGLTGNKMLKRFVTLGLGILALLLFNPDALRADEPFIDFSGYVEDTVSTEYRKADKGFAVLNSARLRNDFSKDFDGKFDFGLVVIGNIYSGDTEINISDYLPDKVLSQYPPMVWQDMVFELENDVWIQEGHASLYAGDFRLRLGRQKYYTGTGYAWNPSDLFNRKNSLDPAYETEGIDGIFAAWSFTGESEVSLFYSIGTSHFRERKTFSSIEDGDFQLKARTHIGVWEIALHYTEAKLDRTDFLAAIMGAVDPENPATMVKWRLLGGETSGQLFGIGLHAEFGYAWLDLYRDPYIVPAIGFIPDIQNHARFLVGADYTFENGLFLIGEYYYEGLGKNSPDDYNLNDRLSFLTGERDSIGKHNIFLGGNYPVTDLITMEMYVISNLNDPSIILNPWLVWIASDNVTVSVTGQLPMANEDSSLGKIGPSIFARLKWTF